MGTKIGIFGSGTVAKTLGEGFLKYGYEVKLGTRDTSKLAEWSAKTGIPAGSFPETAAFGEILVLAVKGFAAEKVLEAAGKANLSGKVILDATNPIKEAPPVNGVLQYFTDLNHSLMETLQAGYPDASFVKAFNSVGSALMVDPDLNGIKPSMFICGNDQAAKKTVTGILDTFGWETEDLGKAEAARAIEPLAILWCIPGFLQNDWVHAFKVLRR
ncbi:MAG TPA: NAD(P)-binding domain-containing protein [Flavilitoribacter sp.]|nr:NAD(P)-binding domain-containing protein [Flavilitoribacter sp.]